MSRLILLLMIDTTSLFQRPPLAAQSIDLGHTSKYQGTSPPAVSGSLPVPTMIGESNNHYFLLEGHDDSVSESATLRDLGDSAPLDGWNVDYNPDVPGISTASTLRALAMRYINDPRSNIATLRAEGSGGRVRLMIDLELDDIVHTPSSRHPPPTSPIILPTFSPLPVSQPVQSSDDTTASISSLRTRQRPEEAALLESFRPCPEEDTPLLESL